MVKRKRISSVPGCEEKNVYSNGLTLMETSDCVGSPDVDTTCQQQQQQQQQQQEEEDIASATTTDDGVAASGIRSHVRQTKASICSPTLANVELQTVSSPKDGVPEDMARKALPSITGPTLRSSARVQKRPGRDTSPTVTSKPAKKNVSTKPGTPTEQGKVRRAWEQWSVEDKNTFFEALCEFGKDFENIQNYIVQKNRKKGHPPQVIKNKDQVRHFYYRTWHKISKHLDISDDVKKQAQELYGLINFGELRKKIGGRLDEKNGQKLNELVHKGATTIRCKGKNLRIKTPICRALKRLNDVEDPKDFENFKLPPRICIELRPRSNRAWSHVQSIAQNPRVRLTVSLQRRLASIITFLQQRWKAPTLKQKDQLLKLCLESDYLQEQLELPQAEENEAVLRLLPRKCDRISLVSVNASTDISSDSVSLQNYRRKVQCLGDFTESTTTPCIKRNAKAGKGKPNAGADEPKKITIDEKHPSPNAKANHKHIADTLTSQQRNADGVLDCGDKCEPPQSDFPGDFKSAECHHEESNSVPAHELTLRQLLALETAANPTPRTDTVFFPRTPSFLCEAQNLTPPALNPQTDETKDCGELNVDKPCDKNDSAAVLVDPSPMDTAEQEDVAKMALQERTEQLEKIKKGWIFKDCRSVTVGEVYLMLGHPSRLILEYEWEFLESKPSPSLPLLDSPKAISSNSSVQHLTAVLGRLLHAASSTFSDLSKAKQDRQAAPLLQSCRCGHHCCSAVTASKSVLPKGAATVRSPSGVRNAKSFKVVLTKAVGVSEAAVTSATTLTTVPGSTNVGTVNVQTDIFRKPVMGPTPSQAAVSKLLTTSTQSEKLVPCDKALKEQLDKYTQHRKAKGRMKKSVFVQRELPLLPKAGPTHSMMTLRIVPNSTQLAGSFMPLLHTSALPSGNEAALRQSAAVHAKMVSLSTASGISNNVSTLMTTHLGGLTTTGPIMTTAGLALPKIAVATPIRLAGTPAAPLVASPAASTGCALILNSTSSPMALPPKAVGSSSAVLATPCSTASMELISTMAKAVVSSSNTISGGKDGSGEFANLTYSHLKYPNLSMRVLQPPCLGTSVVQGLPSTSAAAPKQIIPEISIAEAGLATKLSVSPPCISSILGISLPGPDGAESANLASDVSTDKLLDITLGNSNSGFSGLINLTATDKLINDEEAVSLPTPIITNDVGLGARPSTPVNSPTNSLFKISSPGIESHWFNGDVSEFSLSNFLSHLESPAKLSAPVASSINHTENTSDMDPNFHCVMNENCIDYISKFEDFAAQMTTGDSQSSKKNV